MRNIICLVAACLLLTACDDGSGTDAGAPDGGGLDGSTALCGADRDCGDQSLFCAQWRCRPGEAGTDARGCINLGAPCPDGEGCDEEMNRCGAPAWCTEGRDGCLEPGDCDGDGAKEALACGGDDCDDDDPNRFPGNLEVCDAEGHDEDCNPETLAGPDDGDMDGDGYISAMCCNGDNCGDDCDDSRRDVHPGAEELCNGIDDDCDGFVDEAGAFCPTGTCIGNRCRATGWEHVFLTGKGNISHALTTDVNGNAYLWIEHGGLIPPVDIDGDGSVEPEGAFLVSIDPVGRVRWFTESPAPVSLVSNETTDELMVVTGSATVWFDQATGAALRTSPVPDEASSDHNEIVGAASFGGSIYVAQRLSDGDGYQNQKVLLQRLDGSGAETTRRLLDIEVPSSWRVKVRFDVAVSDAGVALTGATVSEASIGETASGAALSVDGIFVAVFQHDLTPRWSASHLPTYTDYNVPQDVSISSGGEVALAGRYTDAYTPPGASAAWPAAENGFTDSYVLVFASDGSYLWDFTHHGPRGEWFQSVDFDGRAGLLAAGNFSGTLRTTPFTRTADPGYGDGVAVLFDVTDGLVLQGWHVGGAGQQNVTALSGDLFGNFVMLGNFVTDVTLPSGSTFTNEGRFGYQTWAIRIADAH